MGRPPSLNLTGSHTNIRRSRYKDWSRATLSIADVRACLLPVDEDPAAQQQLRGHGADPRQASDSLPAGQELAKRAAAAAAAAAASPSASRGGSSSGMASTGERKQVFLSHLYINATFFTKTGSEQT